MPVKPMVVILDDDQSVRDGIADHSGGTQDFAHHMYTVTTRSDEFKSIQALRPIGFHDGTAEPGTAAATSSTRRAYVRGHD